MKKLKEYLSGEVTKLRVIDYAKDGNTVVVHHVKAYHLIGNYYVYTTKPDEYGDFAYVFVVNYPACNYAMNCRCMANSYSGDKEGTTLVHSDEIIPWEQVIPKASFYPAGEESFILWMDSRVTNKAFMGLAEIRMAEEILKVMKIAGHADAKSYHKYKAWLKQEQERKSRERWEAQEAHERELEEAARKEHEEALEALREALRKDGERIRADFTLLPEVAAGLGINIPIRTQGWIKKKLKAVTIQDGKMMTYYISKFNKRENGSQSFWAYMEQVLDALRKTA